MLSVCNINKDNLKNVQKFQKKRYFTFSFVLRTKMFLIASRLAAFRFCRQVQPLVIRWTTNFSLSSGSLVTLAHAIPSQNAEANIVLVGQQEKTLSWLNRLIQFLKFLLRSLQMTILVSPLLLSAPFAVYIVSFQKHWLNMLVSTIQTCGPVYTKLGQWASTRHDLFPPVLCDHLTKLQRNANIHSWHHTKAVLQANGLEESLAEIDPEVIGSGCCAQVYQAKLRNGRKVAVKVLHPQIKEEFERDLAFLKSLVNGVSWVFPQLNWLSVRESLEEFGQLMSIQVDLRNEAQNLERFRQNFQGSDEIKFPVPIQELCSHNVLVESFEDGEPIGNLLKALQTIPLERRKSIANKGVQMFLKMVFRHNFIHCDLHPGNILVAGDNDDLIILDPGLTASLTPKDQRNFL